MKSYPAKVLLFGEHTVNLGTSALAMPLPAYSSRWQQAFLPKEETLKKQQQLPRLVDWLETQSAILPFSLDTGAFRKALSDGWVLDSNIPAGYGLGSSGSVVAAIVDRWGSRLPKDLNTLRKGLAAMEVFFHGKSSGTDPLVSFLQQPVRISEKGIETVSLPQLNDSGIFLLDTGIRRTATPLIRKFLKAWAEPAFQNLCKEFLLPSVNAAIEKMLAGDWQGLFEDFEQISRFQLRHTPWLIPDEFQPLWKSLLEGQCAALKICGAGGGGFMLGMVRPGASLPEPLAAPREATKKWPVEFLGIPG
ncbi:MAG: hypothetical protein CMN32_09550 [Saprospirales bacterium]|nr:hypothetical protein [Saprospirales bacterium]